LAGARRQARANEQQVLGDGEGPLALAIIDNRLYVAEGKPGRISKVDLANGNKEVFLTGVVGKVGALANDGAGNLLALDGASGRLFRINPKNLEHDTRKDLVKAFFQDMRSSVISMKRSHLYESGTIRDANSSLSLKKPAFSGLLSWNSSLYLSYDSWSSYLSMYIQVSDDWSSFLAMLNVECT
jgi:hypothetical protein